MPVNPTSRPTRGRRPRHWARSAVPLALGLLGSAAAVTALASPASATVSPSQQWATSISNVSGTGVGSSQTYTFGTTGVTAVRTITHRTGDGCNLLNPVPDILDSLNAVNYLTPTPPPLTPLAGWLCYAGGAVSTLEFSRPVLKPLMHVINLDLSILGVSGTSSSGAATHLRLLSHNSTLELSNDILNSTTNAAINPACQADNGSNPTGACGTAEVDGGSGAISTLTLTATSLGGDGSGLELSYPTLPVTPSFSPTSVMSGETATLTYTIVNSTDTAQPDLSGIGFVQPALPTGLSIAAGTPTSSGCGTPTFADGGGHSLGAGDVGLRVTGVAVARGATCRLNIHVTAAAAGTYAVHGAAVEPAVANLVPSGATELTVTAPAPSPGLTLTTTTGKTRITSVGQLLVFTFEVRNTGNVALEGMHVSVLTFSGSGKLGTVTCPVTRLAVGAAVTCTASYRSTATDLAATGISLNAVARASSSGGAAAVASTTSAAHVTAVKATINAGLPGDGAGRSIPLIALGLVLIIGAAVPLLLGRRRLRRPVPAGGAGVGAVAGSGSPTS